MESYQKYEIKKSNVQSDEFTLILYLDDYLTEFADELGTVPRARKDIVTTARQILRKRYPNIKVTMVKVILGGMVVTSIPLILGESSAQAAEPTAIPIGQESSIYYHVSPGDTLWILSMRFNTSVDNIKKANNLSSDVLQLNQRLIIPKAIHTVVAGDYLTVLAKKYGTTVDAIKEANKLTTDATRLGQKLIIPALVGGSQTSVTPPAAKTNVSSYTVVSGDSLSVIAKRFGVSVEALRSANKLTSDLLQVGQTLTIPTSGAEAALPDTTSPVKTTSYIVVAGDSLSVIAKRFGVSVEALRSANKLTSDLLRVGQTLTIPTSGGEAASPDTTAPAKATSYTVVAGDSLSVIAKRFGVSVEALRSANKLTSDLLQVGQTLTIPSGNTRTTVQEERTTFIYSVRSGDNLSVVANRFGVTVDTIRSANNLRTDILQVGQALTIPNGLNAPAQAGANTITYTTHTIASGDNIWDLSVRYGIPQSELLRVNNLTTSSMLSIGQKIKIPIHNIAVKQVVSEKHGEYLDWWTEAQYVFTIGKTAKVTDFATGKSFTIKRTIGANHADSETVTTNDTNIAKAIWGGYSWKTRAVILEMDGRKIAASMSFMPHEREYINNNGIAGHFDVYFGNSTRHVDGKPDSLHQVQVEKAAGLR
jgi:peptidoglycan DL-endopeptidase LytF